MDRKLVVCCTVLAAILFAAIGWFFYHLISEGSPVSEDSVSDSLTEALCAIPMDAVSIYQTGSMSDAESFLSLFASDYSLVVSSLPGEGACLRGAVSLHSTGKNRLSALLVCVLPGTTDEAGLIDRLLAGCAGVIKKNYESAVIYRSSVPDLNFTVYGHYLLCSSSVTLVESSIRLIESGESLIDNSVFVESVKNSRNTGYIAFNHNVAGKIFSEVMRPRYRRYSPFVSHITDWSAFSIARTAPGEVSLTGTLASQDERSGYASVFFGQKGDKSDLTDVLPYNTESCTSIRISDLERFITGYSSFKSSLGRKKQDDGALLTIARNAGVSEVAEAFIQWPDGKERVVLVKAGKPEYFCPEGEGQAVCVCSGVASAVAGRLFSIPDTSACCIPSPGWVMMGTSHAISRYLDACGNVNFFPLSDWLSQTPVKAVSGRGTVVSSMINIGMLSDSLDTVFNGKYADIAGRIIAQHNFNYLTFSVNVGDDGIVPHITLYSEDLEQMPSLKTAGMVPVEGCDDAVVKIPEGPFEVVDFRTGKKNTLEQLPDGRLQLKDERGKSLWTIPFKGRICGSVAQIDYLRNDKLQMLFASGTGLYLLTRLGGYVKPFPVETGKEILYGPRVYDFKSDKNYLLAVLHTDNTVAFYDRNGNRAKGYGEITAPEAIIGLPEPIMTGETVLWAVRTSGQTLIVGPDGVPVADFNRRRRLSPDTVISVESPGELMVNAVDGKSYILNVKTGEFIKQ